MLPISNYEMHNLMSRSNQYILLSAFLVFCLLSVLPTEGNARWGLPGDIPVSGVWSRYRQALPNCQEMWASQRVVYRPSNGTWYFDVDYDDITDHQVVWPGHGALPFIVSRPLDISGAVAPGLGLFRSFSNMWYFDDRQDGSVDRVNRWEQCETGDLPVAGDFDRDGVVDDVAVFRPSTGMWYFDYNQDGTTDDSVGPWGRSGDVPFAGDFDGDWAADDIGLYRNSDATKYIDIDHDGSMDGKGRASTGRDDCIPVVITKFLQCNNQLSSSCNCYRNPSLTWAEIWLFCDGEWWAPDPDSPY